MGNLIYFLKALKLPTHVLYINILDRSGYIMQKPLLYDMVVRA